MRNQVLTLVKFSLFLCAFGVQAGVRCNFQPDDSLLSQIRSAGVKYIESESIKKLDDLKKAGGTIRLPILSLVGNPTSLMSVEGKILGLFYSNNRIYMLIHNVNQTIGFLGVVHDLYALRYEVVSSTGNINEYTPDLLSYLMRPSGNTSRTYPADIPIEIKKAIHPQFIKLSDILESRTVVRLVGGFLPPITGTIEALQLFERGDFIQVTMNVDGRRVVDYIWLFSPVFLRGSAIETVEAEKRAAS